AHGWRPLRRFAHWRFAHGWRPHRRFAHWRFAHGWRPLRRFAHWRFAHGRFAERWWYRRISERHGFDPERCFRPRFSRAGGSAA
ncbi:MAG: hypothetical protein WCI50_12940, partial [Actinomycetes bacterium]